ncbi:MAG TPA: hypothetical protein VF657_24810 [Actinoplanes sp.]
MGFVPSITGTSPTGRHRRPVRAGALLSTSVLTAAIAVTGAATPAYAADWTVAETPNPGAVTNFLSSVDAVAPNDAWATGSSRDTELGPDQRPFLVRWNGTAWAAAGTPAVPAPASLSAVDGTSRTNVWAVGRRGVPESGRAVPLTQRWNGTAWSVVPSPVPDIADVAELADVKALSGNRAWAVGSYHRSDSPIGERTLIQHWNGARWTVVQSPDPDPDRNRLSKVDGATDNDVWAIGTQGTIDDNATARGLVMHWNGTTWSTVTVPDSTPDVDKRVQGATLRDILVVAPDDVWIVGSAIDKYTFRTVPVVLRWNGVRWTFNPILDGMDGGFQGITAVSKTAVYAVGRGIAKWDGTRWTDQNAAVPGILTAAANAGNGTVVGVGQQFGPRRGQTRTLAMLTRNG